MNAAVTEPERVVDVQARVIVELRILGVLLRHPKVTVDPAITRLVKRFHPPHDRIAGTILQIKAEGADPTVAAVGMRMHDDPGITIDGIREIALCAPGPDGPGLEGVLLAELSKQWADEYALECRQTADEALRAGGINALDDVKAMLADIAPSAKRRFDLLSDASVADVLASNYLLKNIISPGELSVWYGEPGCGKSFVLLHIGRALSQGRSVLGRRVRQCAVVYLCAEGEVGFSRRVAAVKARYGEADAFCYIAQAADLFGSTADVEGLLAAVREINAELVVIDTLARVMGGGSENEAADVNRLLQATDRVRRDTGAHVAIIHHTGKDASKGMRGHSSLLAATDAAIEVKKGKDGAHTINLVRVKDGASGDIYGFRLEKLELGQDGDGDLVSSLVVVETGAAETAPKSVKLTTTEQGWYKEIVAIFSEGNRGILKSPTSVLTRRYCVSRDELREALKLKGRFTLDADGKLTGPDRQRFSKALTTLKDKGKIGMTDKDIWLTSGTSA